MARKIPESTINEIIKLFSADLIDKEIADKFGVSASYVNKLRKKQPITTPEVKVNNKNPVVNNKENTEKNLKAVGTSEEITEIELLEMKINSLEQTLNWYKELLKYKKK